MTKAVVVLSGGQDSTYCLGLVCRRFTSQNVRAITFNYGQRHTRELIAAAAVASLFGVAHKVLHVPDVLPEGTSPLTNHERFPEQYADYNKMAAEVGDRTEDTFVPLRNDLFLTLAVAWAVQWGARYVYTGICQNDSANYPDCREKFFVRKAVAINAALGAAPGDGIMLTAPVLRMNKVQQVRRGLNLPGVYMAWAYTHTAYGDEYPPNGRDHATLLRAQAFEEAGVPDPLVVRAYLEGLCPLPTTPNYPRQVAEVDSLEALERLVGAAPLPGGQ